MFTKAFVLALLLTTPALAQVHWRPTDPFVVTAANESWYVQREPIYFAGELYFPKGPAVFFDGNTMARGGHYNGVPLYMDTTIEPYSVVLVPVRRGLMQPYERRRDGDLVGTTGSRTPGFPVLLAPVPGRGIPQAPSSPTDHPLAVGGVSAYTPQEPGTIVLESDEPIEPPYVPQPATADNLGADTRARAAASATVLTSAALRRPENNDGIWIQFNGAKWVSAGRAVPLRSSEFRKTGEYDGFPVFTRTDGGNLIYLPTRGGLVAPYRRK
jgi:hypothetical protein